MKRKYICAYICNYIYIYMWRNSSICTYIWAFSPFYFSNAYEITITLQSGTMACTKELYKPRSLYHDCSSQHLCHHDFPVLLPFTVTAKKR